jgi:hypothetical protein
MRRLLLGLSGFMLTASSGCAVCSSLLDYDYSAHGGRWERGDRVQGRVGSAFLAAEVRRPADDGTEPIPPGRPLTDDEDASGDSDSPSGEGEPGESSDASLIPPTPEKENGKVAPPSNAPPAAAPTTTGKKTTKSSGVGRTNERTSDADWTAKPSRPGTRPQYPEDAASAEDTANAPVANAPVAEGEGTDENETTDAGSPSTDPAGEAMNEEVEGNASGARLQPPANK